MVQVSFGVQEEKIVVRDVSRVFLSSVPVIVAYVNYWCYRLSCSNCVAVAEYGSVLL